MVHGGNHHRRCAAGRSNAEGLESRKRWCVSKRYRRRTTNFDRRQYRTPVHRINTDMEVFVPHLSLDPCSMHSYVHEGGAGGLLLRNAFTTLNPSFWDDPHKKGQMDVLYLDESGTGGE